MVSLQIQSTVLIKANLYAYHIGMISLGIAGVMLGYSLWKSQLLPQGIALWALGGYAVILCGSVLEVMGFDLMLIHTLPGGLWELFIGVWLMVKGFSLLWSQPKHPNRSTAALLRGVSIVFKCKGGHLVSFFIGSVRSSYQIKRTEKIKKNFPNTLALLKYLYYFEIKSALNERTTGLYPRYR